MLSLFAPIPTLSDSQLLPTEKRAAFSLALIYALRMLGLFMVLPVFSLYGEGYIGASSAAIGLAIGIYGLTQAVLQIPMGFLSDRIGRKPVITMGLLVFFAGSLLAAQADHIHTVILGRALQGAGAIAAAVMALAADLTRETSRLRVMAMIGMSIGLSFMLSMLLGPLLVSWSGIAGLFWITAVLALISVAVLWGLTPNPVQQRFHPDSQTRWQTLAQVIRTPALLRLDYGVFVLHLVLSATFVVFPLYLARELEFPVLEHWKVYLPVFALSVVFMVPMIIFAERFAQTKLMLLIAALLLLMAEFGLLMQPQIAWVLLLLVLFFTGFNFMEASLPSLLAKLAPVQHKGSAMGAFSTAQFMGAFMGASMAGLLFQSGGMGTVMAVNIALLLVWLFITLGLPEIEPTKSKIFAVSPDYPDLALLQSRFMQVTGVREAVIFAEEGLACLKVSKRDLDEAALEAITETITGEHNGTRHQ